MSDARVSRNGTVDDGRSIAPKRRCPNCNSDRFKETLSREHCPACGLECDYWAAKSSNAVYEEMIASRDRADDERREREDREYFLANGGDSA
jgi:predicted amidophosphoribosyltransferase